MNLTKCLEGIDWLVIRFEIFWRRWWYMRLPRLWGAIRRQPPSIHPFSRLGVKFTAAQKAKIQEMVKAHKKVEAQRMILDHLKRELGD